MTAMLLSRGVDLGEVGQDEAVLYPLYILQRIDNCRCTDEGCVLNSNQRSVCLIHWYSTTIALAELFFPIVAEHVIYHRA